MKRLTAILIVGAVFASASAWAKEYGDAGTIEVGGTVAFGSRTTKLTDKDTDEDAVDESSTTIDVSPEVSYFVMPGVAVLGRIGIGMTDTDDKLFDEKSSSQDMEIGVGGAYLLNLGKARVGPGLLVRYISETEAFEDDTGEDETTLTGQGVTAGGLLKLPIGGGGVITAALFLDYDMLQAEFEGGGEADVTRMTFGTTVGASIWF